MSSSDEKAESARTARRRAVRILLAANDGASAGHLARAIAIARGLRRVAERRHVEQKCLVVTTSDAHGLVAGESLACVRLPNPKAGRAGGLDDEERRRIVSTTVDAVIDSFAPDLIVVDTFPSGPHGELRGALRSRAKRALVRRHVTGERANDPLLVAGLERFDLAIVADDPTAFDVELPVRLHRVPPITIGESFDAVGRDAARARLELPANGRVFLVATGGGGDAEANLTGQSIASLVAELDPHAWVVVTAGPLAPASPRSLGPRVKVAREAPLAPYLAAFDGAFAAAGYNTAHELAKSGVPAALFARPRAFDDQAERAQRFQRAGLARVLDRFDAPGIGEALGWMTSAPRPFIEAGGADLAALALLDLVMGGAR